jgi:hypothetical protein
MDRGTRRLFTLVLIALIAATGGAAFLLSGSGSDLTGGPSPTARAVDGVVVGVHSAGLDRVRGFSLRTADGATLEFAIGTLENGAAFPPGHLVEHQATAQRIRVSYLDRDDGLVAVRLEDAP